MPDIRAGQALVVGRRKPVARHGFVKRLIPPVDSVAAPIKAHLLKVSKTKSVGLPTRRYAPTSPQGGEEKGLPARPGLKLAAQDRLQLGFGHLRAASDPALLRLVT